MDSSALRAAMVPVSRQMRAYFAPVVRGSETPTVFDPGISGMFSFDAPPKPWLDLGWIDSFQRSYASPTEVFRGGMKGLPTGQFRGPVDARVEFQFRQWGKLQMALAGGAEHMNVLAPAGSMSSAPLGGMPVPAVAVQEGSTASEIVLGPGATSVFKAGCMIAVDVDYQ
jgi:hypothetical protein